MLHGWSLFRDIIKLYHIRLCSRYCHIWHKTCLNNLQSLLHYQIYQRLFFTSSTVLSIILLRPFQASLAIQDSSFHSTLFLYSNLASLILLLNSLFNPQTDVQSPFKNTCFFSFRIPFCSLVIHGLLFGKILTVFVCIKN